MPSMFCESSINSKRIFSGWYIVYINNIILFIICVYIFYIIFVGLHRKLTPKAQKYKEILISGYSKQCTTSIVSKDLINLCKTYYDEARYWKIKCNDLKYINNDNNYYGDIFIIDGIKMRLNFDPNTIYNGKQGGYTALGLNVYLNDNIDQIDIFFELFCNENYAQFKKKIFFSCWQWNMNDEYDEYSLWRRENHDMFLKYNDLQHIVFGYNIEILSRRYKQD